VLWDKWNAMTAGKEMPVSETLRFLAKTQRNIPEAEALSGWLKDNKLGSLLNAFQGDMAPFEKVSPIVSESGAPFTQKIPGKSTMPFEAIKELRTKVGESLDPSDLAPTIPRSLMKGLYKALSQDESAYAKSLGPDAEKAFNRANMFSRGKHERIDTYLQKVQGKLPYEVWRFATSPDSVEKGGHQFLTLNRSLSPQERDVFHATFIKDMGRAPNGQFDPKLFMQRYDNMPAMVRSALMPGKQRVAMDRLQTVIKDMDKAQMFDAPGSQSAYVGAYMIVGALLHAHPKALITMALASSKSENLARGLLNENFIRHIAGVNKVSVSEATVAMNSIANVIRNQKLAEAAGEDQ
jgi:hypothetical protein